MKIAIIGAGISGLYCALKLKLKYNINEVTVFEKQSIIGGRVEVINFDGIDVVSGAGIGRQRDIHLLELCKYLNVPIHEYKSSWNYTFDHVNLEQVINHLKKFINNYDRTQLNFKQYCQEILGNDLYDLFIKTFGYTDSENADFVDTLLDYGFNDLMSGQTNFFIKWKILLERLNNIFKENIKTNSTVKQIKQNKNKYDVILSNNKKETFDIVFVACEIKNIRQIIKSLPINQSLYNNIESQYFCRLYVKLNKPLKDKKINGILVTEYPFQKIIEMDREKCIYMISYSDNKNAIFWNNKNNIKTYVCEKLKKIFKKDFKVLLYKKIIWKEGTHYFKPLDKLFKSNNNSNNDSRNLYLEYVRNPISNLYFLGDGFSRNQGWVEGALESVEAILN